MKQSKYKYIRLMRLATKTYINYKLAKPLARKVDCQRAMSLMFPKNWAILAYYKTESEMESSLDEGDTNG